MNTTTDHEIPVDPALFDGDGMVHTASHVRMWSLTTLYHYQVVGTGLIPRSKLLGGIHYTRAWDLMPPQKTTVG